LTEKNDDMYPVILKLEGRKCLLVGGGRVAGRKIEPLLRAGAIVTLVSPEAVDNIRRYSEEGKIDWLKRKYNKGEAAEYFVVVAATSDTELNRLVSNDAISAGRLINAVDMPDLCNFFVPSVIRRGELQVALSTSGACPALARKLREDLEGQFPETYSGLLRRLREFRIELIASVQGEARRKEILEKVVNSHEVRSYLEGDGEPLEELLKRCI